MTLLVKLQIKMTLQLQINGKIIAKRLISAGKVQKEPSRGLLNPLQDGHFWGCSRMGEGGKKHPSLPKICHTYPTMMKLSTVIPYLKKIQKIYKSHETSLSSANISIFSPEISKCCYIEKYRYRLYFLSL